MEVKDDILFNYLFMVTKNALEKIEGVLENSYDFSFRHFEWPVQSRYGFPNGMPSFSTSSTFEKNPRDYTRIFNERLRSKPEIDITELEGFPEYYDHAINSEVFMQRFFIESEKGENDKRLLDISIKSIPESLIERYLHIYGEQAEFTEDGFKCIYKPVENYIYNDVLKLDIVVPILFIKFEFDNFKINSNTFVEKMDDSMQLSRTNISNYAVPIHKTVVGSATHALVLKNYEVQNQNKWVLENLLSEQNAFPTELIDDFFNSIRVAFGYETGYAQLISKPVDWSLTYKGNLDPMQGTLIKAYPSKFDDFYWLKKDLPTLKVDDTEYIGKLFLNLQKEGNQKLKIANHRLKHCYLRDNEQDAVIDAMIALETLLSDGERSELNHKLSLRMAAILSTSNRVTESPQEIFKTVKKIYDYRSAIVHGSPKAERKREIKLEGAEPVPVIEKVMEYLRLAISVILNNPNYLKASKIDEDLILDKLNETK